MKIGDNVIYVDQYGVEHEALVTNSFGSMIPVSFIENGEMVERLVWPAINLVYVNKDEKCSDGYGRQILRHSSIVHQTSTPAHGNYWKAK